MMKRFFGFLAAAAMLASLSTGARAQSLANFRNVLIGGDFATNLWQRGTSFAAITTGPKYAPDRWFVGAGAGSAMTISRQTVSGLTGFSRSLRMQRNAANADVTPIYTGQVLESANSTPLAGQTVVLSFYALAGATFSPTSSAINATITCGTGTDEGSAALVGGTWTGQADAVSAPVSLTTAWARYAVTAAIPTSANECAVRLSFTPVGTAGANDYMDVTGIQLEIASPGATAVAVQATPFERRPAGVEAILQYRYDYVLREAGTAAPSCMGQAYSTTQAYVICPLPVPMRARPASSQSVEFIAQSSPGSFNLSIAAGTTAGTINTLGLGTTGNYAAGFVNVTNGSASLVAGNATYLSGVNGSGYMNWSAEL